MSDNNGKANHNLADGLLQAIPGSSSAEEEDDWSVSLWDDDWDGDIVLVGEAHLCFATKKWGDGTVDVLVAHYPVDEDSVPTAYAHRHGNDVTPLTVHGPADDVVGIVTSQWGPPQVRQTSWDS